MASQKKLPTRRDRREALGYLQDLFDTGNEGDRSHEIIAERLVDHAYEVKVQRATDRLVLYFDLRDDESGALPEATEDGGPREYVPETARVDADFRLGGDPE